MKLLSVFPMRPRERRRISENVVAACADTGCGRTPAKVFTIARERASAGYSSLLASFCISVLCPVRNMVLYRLPLRGRPAGYASASSAVQVIKERFIRG